MDKFFNIMAKITEFIFNNYSDEIAYAVGSVILIGLGYLVTNVKNNMLKSLFEKAVVAVQVTQQVLVDDLKEKSTDGKLSPEEKAEVAAHAKKVFFEQVGILGQFIYSLVAGSLDKWFETQKDYILAELKKKSLTVSSQKDTSSTNTVN